MRAEARTAVLRGRDSLRRRGRIGHAPERSDGEWRCCFSALQGRPLRGADGVVGTLRDMLLDEAWAAHAFVVDTGRWLIGRRAVIPADAVSGGRADSALTVSRTWQAAESDGPIAGLYMPWGMIARERGRESTALSSTEQRDLHGARDAIGCAVEGANDDIGVVADMVVDARSWAVRYLVVDAGAWLPGRLVPIAPRWISASSWADRCFFVNLARDQVQGSPAWDPARPFDRDEESRLWRWYGFTPDW